MIGYGDKSFDDPRAGAGGGRVEVDPTDLHLLGNMFTTAACDAAEAFTRCHTDLDDYSGTMFTATRAALVNKVDSWRDTTGGLLRRVDSHGHELHSGAAEYQNADSSARADVIRAAGQGR